MWSIDGNGIGVLMTLGHDVSDEQLRLRAEMRPAGGGHGPEMAFGVDDEGVGIAPEDVDGIFQPFRGGFANGTGLGLSIVHRIVTDHGGTIRVRSGAGGTCFSVSLPLIPSP